MRNIFCLSAVLVCLGSAHAEPQIDSRAAKIDNVELHYLTAGHGPAVILLHGFAETARMWRPIIPLLAEKFTVIAPDLPGIGDSSIPADKIDMLSAASRIHALVRSRKRTPRLTLRRIRNRAGCARRGLISRLGRAWQAILRSSRKRN